MTLVTVLLGLAALLAVVAVALAVSLIRGRGRARAELAAALARADLLQERVDGIEQQMGAVVSTGSTDGGGSTDGSTPEYLVTTMPAAVSTGSSAPRRSAVPARIEGRLFADLVLRETVVKAAALLHGVRRALDPEVRFRARYAMKREIKRSRKERRIELREARAYLRARRARQEDAA